MKNIIKYAVTFLALAAFALSCEEQNTPERINIQHPDEQSPILRDDAYYARLRAYKKTHHKLAFGWYGSWTAVGASAQTRLVSAPDSMDIISIWSQWHSLTPQQMADKEAVQKIKGTKVTYTIFAHEVPATFLVDGQVTPEGLAAYAKAYAKDSMDKYQYDGIDLDYEPGFGGVGPLVGHNNENMKIFCQELSKYVGPKSGTGRLLIIDGVPFAVHSEIAELFDYGIVQAYSSYGYRDLQSRYDEAFAKGWKPAQYIFAENFEAYWKTGGVPFGDINGKTMPSLFGMATFNPTQGEGGGFGSYHMEYEYGHADMPYRYMRQAIQLANPAPQGDFTKNLVSINNTSEPANYIINVTPSGVLFGDVKYELSGYLANPAASETEIAFKVDNSLIASYNDKTGMEYKSIDPTKVVFSNLLHVALGAQKSDNTVGISLSNLAELELGEYLIPVCPDLSENSALSINELRYVKYLTVTKQVKQIQINITNANNFQNRSIMSLVDGSFVGDVSYTIPSATLSQKALSNINFGFVADNDLVATYNKKNGTTYQTIDVAKVVLTGTLSVAKDATETTGSVACSVTDLSAFQSGYTMIALRPELSSLTDYVGTANAGIQYILVYKGVQNIASQQNLEAFKDHCTKIDNAGNKLGWKLEIVNLGSSGGNGVWNFDNRSDMMFDGQTNDADQYWYAIWGNYWSWNHTNGGQLTLDMKSVQSVNTLLWWASFSNANYLPKTLKTVATSLDGKTWTVHNSGNVDIAKGGDYTQWISFIKPVNARYIRIVIIEGQTDQYCGMSEMEVWKAK